MVPKPILGKLESHLNNLDIEAAVAIERSKSWLGRAVSETAIFDARLDAPQLKKDLMVPYPPPKLGNEVFGRALRYINVLERDVELLKHELKQTKQELLSDGT